tara:strand:- start:11 stop:349 length:339 start_codon:yes stop_codon:yes gene_type:complete
MNKYDKSIVESSIAITGATKQVQISLWKYSKQLLTNKVSLVESDLIEFINNESDENRFSRSINRFNENGTQENFYTTYKPKKVLCCKRLFQPCKLHQTKGRDSKVTTIKPKL